MLHLVQPEEVKATIGRNVAQHRARLGWSQAELAARWSKAQGKKIDPTTVTRLERGRRPISVDELVVLADVFGLRWWEDLARPAEQLALAARLREVELRLGERYGRILDAAKSYLTLQVLAQRQVADAKALGISTRRVDAWISQPAEAAVINARLGLEGYADEMERAQVARERGQAAVEALEDSGISTQPPAAETPVKAVAVTIGSGAQVHFETDEVVEVAHTREEKRAAVHGVTINAVEQVGTGADNDLEAFRLVSGDQSQPDVRKIMELLNSISPEEMLREIELVNEFTQRLQRASEQAAASKAGG